MNGVSQAISARVYRAGAVKAMKKKIFVGLAGVLLASSTMFAQWRDRDDHHHERYEHHDRYERRGGVYLGVAPGYYGYTAPAPYVDPYADQYANPYYAPGPYVDGYVAPYYGGGWIGGHWNDRRHERNWDRDRDRRDWGHRR